jgi:hypothetical protein
VSGVENAPPPPNLAFLRNAGNMCYLYYQRLINISENKKNPTKYDFWQLIVKNILFLQ